MTTALDLGPATRRMADLVANVPDGMLDAPTPCPAYSLGDLLEHVGGLALAFTAAATKTGLDDTQARPGDASRLGDGWRARIPGDLAKLAEAWRDPAAWTGMTSAGGIEMPGEIAGLVALNEVVVHGWDVAKAAGQPYDGDTASLEATRELAAQFGESDRESGPTAAFGPVVEVPDHATLLDRVIGLNGRDPQWHSPRHR